MKNRNLPGLCLIVTLAVFGATCQSTTSGNRNSSAMKHDSINHGSMNQNSMMTNGNSAMNHNSMMNSNHDMSDMKSSPNAANQPYDVQFLDTMTHHHQGALDMAKTAVGKTQNAELKAFAQKIIDDQNKEITQMKEWREKWYSGKPAAMNMEMPGMDEGMKTMTGDAMKKLEAVTGKDFDIYFLDIMTPHHAGAITMSTEALQKAEHPEIKTLANNIIKAQEAEIKQMADWKAKWSK